MGNTQIPFQRKVHDRDLAVRIGLALVAAHWVVSFGEPETIFELMLMGDYWRSLVGSWVIAFGLVSLVRWICLKLDQRLDWQQRMVVRGVIQAAIGIGLISLLAYMAAAVYFAVHGIDIRDTVYISLDWPLIVAMLLVINLYYLIFYIVVVWRQNRNAGEPATYRQVIIVQVAAKNIPINVQDIAYFVRLNDENFLRTTDGTDYLITDALDYIESLLDPALLFRANRRILAHFQACERFESIENDKLVLFVSPAFKERIIISQKRASAFKAWIGR